MFLRGGVAAVVLVLIAAFVTAYTKGNFSSTVEVDAIVDNAGGSLTPGADVKSSGVIVGRATDLRLVDDGVKISLTLKGRAARDIPGNVVARVLPATVFGTSYVDLVAPTDRATDTLKAGQIIPQDRRVETLELQQTLDNLYRVVTAVRPAELSTTLTAISTALDGRGDEIGATMARLDRYLGRLEPRLPTLQEDIRLLADNLENLERVTPDLLDAVDDGLVTARTITAKRASLTSLLTGSGALVANADDLLTDNEESLVRTIRQTAVITDVLYDERAQMVPGFRSFVDFGRGASDALSDGPFIRVDGRFVVSDVAPYTAADCPRYGSLAADNCAGGGGGSGATASSGSDASQPDAAVLDSVRGRLGELESGGVGELLSRPLIGATP